MGTATQSASKALGSSAASVLLEPSNELGDGEGLGKLGAGAGARGRSRLGSRLGRSSGLGGGRCAGLSSSGGGGGRGEDEAGGDGGSAGSCGRGRLGGNRSRGRGAARAGAAAGDRATRGGVVGQVEAVVEVGDVDVGIIGLVSSRELDGRTAGAGSGTSDLELGAAHVELGTIDSLGAVEGQHLGAEEVLAAGETGGELELVGHVVGSHDLVGPLAALGVEFVNLEPFSDTSSILGGVDRAEKHVGDGSRVAGLIPLDLDGVTLLGIDSDGDTLLSVDVAGDVLAGDIGHGAVRGRHADTDILTRGLSVDPELVEVLVG